MSSQSIKKYNSESPKLFEALEDLNNKRILIKVFALRDLKVKYADTILGIGWSILKPALSTLVYSIILGYFLTIDSKATPYPIYVLTGLISWNLISFIISQGVISVFESKELFKKKYFPKSILPISKCLVGSGEALISSLLLIPLFIFYEQGVNWKLILFPIAILFSVITGLTISMIISAYSITKRDLIQVIPFGLQIAIWLSPVFLIPDILPEPVSNLIEYNPISSSIEFWRYILIPSMTFKSIWIIHFTLMLVLQIWSFHLFSSREHKLADQL